MRFMLIAAAALALGACDKSADGRAAAPAGDKASEKAAPKLVMAPVDVVYEDFKATIDAPKGATFKESYGTLEVKLGDGKDFFVQIDTDAPDMAKVKASVKKNDVQKLVKFHTESADTFVYETKFMRKQSFWLDTAVKVGDKTVHCYSGRGANSYTAAHIATMEAACKSLKPKG